MVEASVSPSMMTRLGALVKVSFSLQLITVRAGPELDEVDFSVDDPAQALRDIAHRPVRIAAVTQVARRRVWGVDMVFSFIVAG